MRDLENILLTIHDWAKEERWIYCVYVFGSRARGDHRENSDLDICIKTRGGEWGFESDRWKDELQRLFETKIHLVEYQHGNAEFISNIKREGKIAYNKFR